MIDSAIKELYSNIDKVDSLIKLIDSMLGIEIYVLDNKYNIIENHGKESSPDREIDASFSLKKINGRLMAYRLTEAGRFHEG